MAWVAYDKFMEKQMDGNAIDLKGGANGLKMGLTTVSYSPSSANDALWTDGGISANEVSGTNYTAGGAAVANDTITRGANLITFDGDDVTWSQHASGFTDARIAVIYEVTSNKLICYNDFGASKGNVTGDLTVQMDAAGILTLARV